MKQSRGKSSREIRRMMARQEQQQQNREKVKQFWSLPQEQRDEMLRTSETAQRIQRNGITLEDLAKEYDKGFVKGFNSGADSAVMTCYAGVCMALNKLYGFGKKRCLDVLRALDEQVLYSITGAEAAQEVFDKMGLRIALNETFPDDRVQEGETA